VVAELYNSTIGTRLTRETADGIVLNPRNLLSHAWITLSATLLGFLMGAALGIGLAVAIIHSRVLQKSLMPWIIASQTIPILAIAPIIIVALGSVGLTGLIPKAIISMYLCFFPVTIGMVKGFTSPDAMQLDLMRTYNASRPKTFWKLRWPSAVPYLFAGLKVAISISLVGAIVGELPTGAQAGIGARLLSGSYYGQTIQIWSALVLAALMAAGLIAAVALAERMTLRAMGVRR
jgi:NitT/TauT family transport system permease protein